MSLIPVINRGKVSNISADHTVKLNGLTAFEYHFYDLDDKRNRKCIRSHILGLHNQNKIPSRFYS